LSQPTATRFIAVYCSSSDRVASKYLDAALALGAEMAARGFGLVFGGARVGSMGRVAWGMKNGGGRVIGVMPKFMRIKGIVFEEADEIIETDTMRERKQIIEERADAFVALPGGWGTLDEMMEILTLQQLNLMQKPCVFFNQDGFFDGLLRLFEKMTDEHFAGPSIFKLFRAATTVEEIFEHLNVECKEPAESKWFVP
jgi:uncharacterized protein (TIGR00730 family)